MRYLRSNKKEEGINFIGLGKLGLPLSCLLAEAKFKVNAYDRNPHTIDSLKKGTVPFFEPNLNKLFSKVKKNFVSLNIEINTSILLNDKTVILVDTQDPDFGYSKNNIENVIIQIAKIFKNAKPHFHSIIISSTMTVGDIEYLINLMERESNWLRNRDFSIVYVPDFVKLGSVLEDFRNPEFIMVGAPSEKAFNIVKSVWSRFVRKNTHFGHLNYSEAELGKIALNAYIVNKISFANHLGLIAEEIGNVNPNKITSLIGLDKRISSLFFKAGMPYGGTCFPRDAKAYTDLGRKYGQPALHLEFAEKINSAVLKSIYFKSKLGKSIGVIGVSFKPDSPVMIDSPSLKLMRMLVEDGKEVFYFDKLVDKALPELTPFKKCVNVKELSMYCDTIILMHPEKSLILEIESSIRIIDPWGIIGTVVP
jgi:UDPglucose 6-dehydrogenase